MAKTHVKQHYVPQSYLSAWCDPNTPEGHEPYVWMFPADGGDPKKKPPSKIFYENEMYTRSITIEGVRERDLHIEHGLCEIEGDFARLRSDFLSQRKLLPRVPLVKLLAFVAAQKARTPRVREHLRTQWGRVLERMDELSSAMEQATPEERKRIAGMSSLSGSKGSMSHTEVRTLASNPLQETIIPTIQALTPKFLEMNVAFLCTEDDIGFITSDEPCAWNDPEGYKRPPLMRAPGLAYRSIEITMPLTPHCMLLLTWEGPSGYVEATREFVDEMNRRTRAFCQDAFVSRSSVAQSFWYE